MVFQLVFLICSCVVSLGVKAGRNGLTRLDMTKDRLRGKSKPNRGVCECVDLNLFTPYKKALKKALSISESFVSIEPI